MKKQLLAITVISALVTGCAAPARVDQMTSTKIPSANAQAAALKSSIQIQPVTGGKATNPLWTSQVSSEAFQSALSASLNSAGLLGTTTAPYTLDSKLVSLKQPKIGLDMTVTATVDYQLMNTSSKAAVFKKTIITPYTATVGDAFVGTERLKLANEGAIRKNIEEIIDVLLNAKLQDGQISVAP
ncbi:MAG: hypothetical protein RLY58_229 [Pseudomonadota bacterium]|jgi:hypothetical protein